MAGNIAKRPDGRWRARYRDERGKERARHFDRRIDAQRWLDEVTSTIRDGTWVELRASNVTFDDFYAEWAPRQLWLPSTRANADLAVGSVPFGDPPLPHRSVGQGSLREVGADDRQGPVRHRPLGVPRRPRRPRHRLRPLSRGRAATASQGGSGDANPDR